ncbi:Uncharacterised protein [Mycobacteroides abscessus subsp. abscessus]|nr:Uncharacterised protein [Mycobacteroides abscessus subsp. abscessus]
MDLERTLRRAAGDPALHQPCGRPVRPAQVLHLQHQGVLGPLAARRTPLGGDPRFRRGAPLSLPGLGRGRAVDAEGIRRSRNRQLHRDQGLDQPLDDPAGGSGRQTRRRDRHGIVCGASDSAYRRRRRTAHRLPAHAELRVSRAQRAVGTGRRRPGQARLPRDPRGVPPLPRWHPRPPRHRQGLRRQRRRAPAPLRTSV